MEDKLLLQDLVRRMPSRDAQIYHLDRTPSGRHTVCRRPQPAAGAVSRESLAAPETELERAIADLFRTPDAMMFVVDTVEGRFLQVNRKVCEVLGYSERELLETSFLERVHPDDLRRTLLEIGRLNANKHSEGFRNRHLTADGAYRTLEWTAVADPGADLCYAMAVVVDG
jgi:PAS domain S-box-containing protein